MMLDLTDLMKYDLEQFCHILFLRIPLYIDWIFCSFKLSATLRFTNLSGRH